MEAEEAKVGILARGGRERRRRRGRGRGLHAYELFNLFFVISSH
jgi:hypothetical protein